LQRVPPTAAAIHVGSFAMVVEPIASTLRTLVEREHDRTLISYDPNVRLNVDPDLARWRGALDWMLTRAHVVKISEEDLGLLCPGASASDFCDRALACGVRLVVVTRGASGAVGGTASRRAAVSAPTVPLVDTVGAGDAFQAALLAWLGENDALRIDAIATRIEHRFEEALRFACTAASLACSRRGADLPTRDELAAACSSGAG
jgi:fructokinase